MKYQVCYYQANKDDKWVTGLAAVKAYGLSDVAFILDAHLGDRILNPWDYRLVSGPMSFLATDEDSLEI